MNILLAGMESGEAAGLTYPMLAERGLGALVSYWALKTDAAQERAGITRAREAGVMMAIDSGAFSLQQPKFIMNAKRLDEYIGKYISFLDKFAGCFIWAADLDIEFSYGLDVAAAALARLEKSGHPICPVWHPEQGISGFAEYCSRFKFVGIASQDYRRRNKMTRATAAKLGAYAFQHGIKLHIMGGTDYEGLNEIPCYTADSTTWMNPQLYAKYLRPDGTSPRTMENGQHVTGSVVIKAIITRDDSEKLTSRAKNVAGYTLDAIALRQRNISEAWERRGVTFN